jgi:hypothetical protein
MSCSCEVVKGVYNKNCDWAGTTFLSLAYVRTSHLCFIHQQGMRILYH